MADVHIGLDDIARHLHELDDPRSEINRRHPCQGALKSGSPAELVNRSERSRSIQDRPGLGRQQHALAE
jgi:hypothetical protein